MDRSECRSNWAARAALVAVCAGPFASLRHKAAALRYRKTLRTRRIEVSRRIEASRRIELVCRIETRLNCVAHNIYKFGKVN